MGRSKTRNDAYRKSPLIRYFARFALVSAHPRLAHNPKVAGSNPARY
jgi:hypothetical protein